MISIAIDNGRNNTVGGACYSAHQAVSKFADPTLIWPVEFIAKTRAGVSGDVNKTL